MNDVKEMVSLCKKLNVDESTISVGFGKNMNVTVQVLKHEKYFLYML